METGYYIVIDFDGTVVKHRYPAVGDDIGAVSVLHMLVQNGHKLILNTMRSRNSDGADTLQPAIEWFSSKGIPLYGVNENPSQKQWTASPKVYGNIYIDDGALGAPLKIDEAGIPFIDWSVASLHLYVRGLLTRDNVLQLAQEGIISLTGLSQQLNFQGE